MTNSPTTERLYYTDAYTTQFSAHLIGQTTYHDQPAVMLDRTYFYPAGGGQPHDCGIMLISALNNDPTDIDIITSATVIEVVNQGDEVLHVLDHALPNLPNAPVACQIDWTRRFDFMQHHTGQHILSQAFIQTANAHTVGFHLSGDTVTIDLDSVNLSAEALAEVEEVANRVIYSDLSVTARLIDPADAEKLGVRMRKMPEQIYTAGLRVIDVGGFDLTACGGTHVSRTGEIGAIRILKMEKKGDKTRVEFVCGWRALHDSRVKNTIVNRLAADLTCGVDEIPSAITRLKTDLQSAQRTLKAVTDQLLQFEAERLIAAAPLENGVRFISAAFEGRDANELRSLAALLIENPATIALLGTSGDKAQLYIARSLELSYNLNPVLKTALETFGGRGGGQPGFVQGGGVPATLDQVRAALKTARMLLMADNIQ